MHCVHIPLGIDIAIIYAKNTCHRYGDNVRNIRVDDWNALKRSIESYHEGHASKIMQLRPFSEEHAPVMALELKHDENTAASK